MTSTAAASVKREPAMLVLGDGKVFRGFAFGTPRTTYGEAVFTTAMTGYQETMTDPSYHRQIAVLAAPQIGNTGWNDTDSESRDGKIWVAGLVIRDLSVQHSSWRAERSLEEEMQRQQVPGIYGIDTRTLVRHLRNHGSIAAGLFFGSDVEEDVASLVDKVNAQPKMAGASLSEEVSTNEPYTIPADGESKYTVVAYDMGVKAATPRHFAQLGITTIVVPANTPYADIQQYKPDGVFISNGPGDPATADEMVEITRDILRAQLPLFGICFGNQILGRAFGLETYKLQYGHRGVNVPVKNVVTGKIDITSQNHGFALAGTPGESFATDFGPARVTHVCLNDGTVEGVALESGLAYSVQYHPESAAGPHDANPLFEQFTALMDQHSPNK